MSFPLRQVAVTGLIAILALAAVSFARVVIVELQLHRQEQALEREVANLKAENQQLETKIAYLQTDPAIEELAREELGWTKDGDTAVVVSGTPSPAPSMTPVAPDSSRAARATWWDSLAKELLPP